MKKALLFASIFTVGLSYAQDCSKIFISEYVEGWGNNKALEIYNPTNQTINLSEYIVARYSNGSNTATVNQAVQLTGTIAPYDVYVGVVDLRDPNGTGQTAPIWDSLEVRADGFYSADYEINETWYWNGNDAIVLFKGSLAGQSASTQLNAIDPPLVPIDIFGKVGESPAIPSSNPLSKGGWTNVFPYNNGQGVILTEDHSLIRKPTIKKGETNFGISFFNALAEYDTIPAVTYLFDQNGDTIKSVNGNAITFGNWFSLGSHDCECNPLSVKEKSIAEVSVYPNPSTNGVFAINSNEMIEAITVYNALGQTIADKKVNAQNYVLNIGDRNGVYLVKVSTSSGVATKRLIIK